MLFRPTLEGPSGNVRSSYALIYIYNYNNCAAGHDLFATIKLSADRPAGLLEPTKLAPANKFSAGLNGRRFECCAQCATDNADCRCSSLSFNG